ncbi:MAG TPA: phosphomannose isomerase type II C-terminal cupin domain [Spirochaetota bacterium]|nr:phosphomannose isomerase type II C-terminal cupin domain [Spirochaetota bacterium]HPV40732.1 phosphomannose isomerase type II C-terminal cupin domain [Spirochaetota bacterium]
MDIDDSKRPWGYFENLVDAGNHKVKRITVFPGKRLSLQSHAKRAEHWFVVDGRALFTCNDTVMEIRQGQAVDIGRGDRHRIENIGTQNLVFIEIQTGDYFGEDDITRYEDDFGRAKA